MEHEMYDVLYEIEKTHWAYRAKSEIVESILDECLPSRENKRLLDVGCGCGLMLQSLQKRGEAEGLDYSQTAIDYCRNMFSGRLIQWDLNNPLQFDHGFDGIVALDILEHVADDSTAIRTIAGALNPGGVAVITVPAHQWMWTIYDEYNMHQRRYTKEAFENLCRSTGLTIRYLSWLNCWLFPPIAAFRLLERAFPRRGG